MRATHVLSIAAAAGLLLGGPSMSSAETELGPHPLSQSPEALITLRDQLARDPWGGAVVAIHALIGWDAEPPRGESMLVLAVSERNVDKVKGAAASAPGTYKGYALSGAFKAWLKLGERYRHCARAYVVGATPENRYAIDPAAITIRFRSQDKAVGSIESGTYKVFVCSAGADTCRPITMKRNKLGLWKADEMSSLLAGCKAMVSAEPDDKENDL